MEAQRVFNIKDLYFNLCEYPKGYLWSVPKVPLGDNLWITYE